MTSLILNKEDVEVIFLDYNSVLLYIQDNYVLNVIAC